MKKFAAMWLAGGLLVLSLFGCGFFKSASVEGYHKISPQEAKQMMEKQAVTIVDVRRSDEYKKGHIPQAILVPNETIGSEPMKKLPDKEAVLLVYCRSGVRSKDASIKLIQSGYKNVYDMGGIMNWSYEITQ